jgi:hypothetical protein
VVNCKKKKIESIRDGIALYHFCSGGDGDCFRHHGRIPLNEIARAAKADTLNVLRNTTGPYFLVFSCTAACAAA